MACALEAKWRINSVRQLCDHAIWIDKGNVRMSGLVEEVTTEYMHMNQ